MRMLGIVAGIIVNTRDMHVVLRDCAHDILS